MRKLETTKAVRVKLPHGEGIESPIVHTDGDGEGWVCRTLALRSNGRAFSLVHRYEAGDAAEANRLARPTLESIRTR